MTLHRDIYWLGRQWAVTGDGIQAIDQKRYGQYDVDSSRIGDDDVGAALQVLEWFDAEDFREALRQARRRPQSGFASFPRLTGGEK
ncbi:MAG TPA: hypothetical protein VN130_11500 [Xanthobacteraceae bacterium]|nr:hypothetical protein [Xanthobacteraceae bacterium]